MKVRIEIPAKLIIEQKEGRTFLLTKGKDFPLCRRCSQILNKKEFVSSIPFALKSGGKVIIT